jgi:hypothetical protein
MKIQDSNPLLHIRTFLEGEEVCGATAVNVTPTYLIVRDYLRAGSESIDGNRDDVGRAITKWLEWQTSVAGRDTAGLTKTLARVAGDSLNIRATVQSGGAVAHVWSSDEIKFVSAVKPVEVGNGPGNGKWAVGRRLSAVMLRAPLLVVLLVLVIDVLAATLVLAAEVVAVEELGEELEAEVKDFVDDVDVVELAHVAS